jgi:anti-sigma B factor antagonist
MSISKTDNTGVIRLPGALEIYEAETLRSALLEQLAASSELVLDLGSVESCDTAGAQLLLSARRAAALAGKSFRCVHVPAAVTEVWAKLGLPLDLITTPSN